MTRALCFTEKLIVDTGYHIVLSADQYTSILFEGCTDYFTKLCDNHFNANVTDSSNNITSHNWASAGYQQFTYDEDYESDEEVTDNRLKCHIHTPITKKNTEM